MKPHPASTHRIIFLLPKATRAVLLLAGIAASSALAANWPNWRGPLGDGTTTTAQNLPETWSLSQNVKWKQEMPAWSGSSPTVWGERIFLNTPSKDEVVAPPPAPAPAVPGKKARPKPAGGRGPGGQDLLLLCLDRATGQEIWRRQYDRGNDLKMKHNMTSPTPVTDGKHVWVVSGNGVVACFDFDGHPKWTFDIPKNFGKIGIQFGYGSSPLLVGDKLIFQMLQGLYTDEPCYLFALNANDGRKLWHVERPTDAEHESPDAYSTPALLEVAGKKQVVVGGSDYVTGHDPETGRELWRGGGLNPTKSKNFRVIASPLVRDGMIFAPSRVTPFIAFKAGGTGDITTSQLAWKWTEKGSPDVPTPVSDGERLYMVDDQGAITCVKAATGERIYGPESTGIGRTSGSPTLADGKIYVTSETTETAVIQAGATFKLLGKNTLDGSYTLSTPAFVDGEIIMRTGTHLYCLKK
ncbi:MAG: outer membrane protein assembly factor BamB precursor [Verrucomicrobiota bacterium]|jgi:outer membrane protein assembly factor BamB